MKKVVINGDKKLTGTIRISGAKNAAVALIPAAILTDEEVTICNVPEISDIDALEEILEFLNVKVKRDTESIIINTKNMKNKSIPEGIAKKLRASYYFMGALLAKYKEVEMYFPGGCNIGKRPINIHLEGFKKLGAVVEEKKDKYKIKAEKLKGANIYLDVASVGATINLMIAATKAEGTTTIENAAREPEIVNVATFLNSMGANIKGAGTSVIKIKGVEKLSSGFAEIIPDRIEAGTYIIAGALVGENLKVENIIPEHIESLIKKLKEMEIKTVLNENSIIVSANPNMKPTNITTKVYPGFPTDLQQPIVALLSVCKGCSIVEETIYENRFNNVEYLNKLGANIKINNRKLMIEGTDELYGTEVEATDLRAGACLLLASLYAEGTTTIKNADYILRGYENITQKLKNVGAKIELEEYNKVGI